LPEREDNGRRRLSRAGSGANALAIDVWFALIALLNLRDILQFVFPVMMGLPWTCVGVFGLPIVLGVMLHLKNSIIPW
jgi:hypothetical protein